MSEVVVMVPSRSRPESLLKTWESVRDTSNADLIAYVDRDQRADYESLGARMMYQIQTGVVATIPPEENRFSIMVGKRIGPVHAINQICHIARNNPVKERYPDARIWMYLTDDSTIGPHGWDRWLIEAIDRLPNRIGVVSLNHGDAPYVNFYALSTEMVEAVGWYALPVYAWYWDTAMELIGDGTELVWSKPNELAINHMVQCSDDRLSQPPADLISFHEWIISDRRNIIARVRKARDGRS